MRLDLILTLFNVYFAFPRTDVAPFPSSAIVSFVVYGVRARLQRRLRQLPWSAQSLLGVAALPRHTHLLGNTTSYLRRYLIAKVTETHYR